MKKYLTIFLVCFLLFGASVPAFASTSDLVPPNLDDTQYNSYYIDRFTSDETEYYHVVVYHTDDWYVFYDTKNSAPYLFAKSDIPKVTYTTTIEVNKYDNSTSNNGWGVLEQHTKGNIIDFIMADGTSRQGLFLPAGYTATFLDSNQTIYYGTRNAETKTVDFTSEVFFSLIPPLTMATEEALNLFQTQTFQTILTIALCGVGCLALLIGLNLLRKVLPQFLNR